MPTSSPAVATASAPTPAPASPAFAPVPTYLPWGRTARRLDWAHLPPQVRFDVEARLGSPVVADSSLEQGFVPVIETVLTCADGSTHLLRAASAKAQRTFAAALRAEARWLSSLPTTVPVPSLTAFVDGDWVVLLLDGNDTRLPQRPWQVDELDRCLDTVCAAAAALTPAPGGEEVREFAEDLADWLGRWDILEGREDLGTPLQLLTAGRLASRLPEVTAGDTLVHTDLRDDTLRLAGDGRVLLDGWAWPVRGAAWLDALLLLVGPCGDGIDVESVLRRTPLLAAVPDDDVDCVLAAMAGFFLTSCDLAVPSASPWLREFQRWQGEAVWGWLRHRRGWGPLPA